MKNIKHLLLLLRTLSYLKPCQIYYRLKYALVPCPQSLKVVPQAYSFLKAGHPLLAPQSLLDDGTFYFLHEAGKVVTTEDWNSPAKSKLWLYNLHYFDDLNAKDAAPRVKGHAEWIHRWIDENPIGYGNGWEAYPISLRIVNWIKWSSRNKYLSPSMQQSLEKQTEVLFKRLEYHILGNHLFANAKALIFSGVFFKGERANLWLRKGLQILSHELKEQFLLDGGHFERTPMYHSIVLTDLLDLIALQSDMETACAEAFRPNFQTWRNIAEKALFWLQKMCHPDGQISFFNDAAFHIAATPEQLFSYAAGLGLSPSQLSFPPGVLTFAESGYSRVEMAGQLFFLDHAPLGPAYLTGHGHADSLSIEWSIGGQRVIVNSGTSCYGQDATRVRQRRTCSHSTVTVDGCDSSEVWGGFRTARRANSSLLSCQHAESSVVITAEHDGYMRLPGRNIHRRQICLSQTRLQVVDIVEGAFRTAIVRFFLHPAINVSVESLGVRLVLPAKKNILVNADIPITVQDAEWHPEFGRVCSTKMLELKLSKSRLQTVFEIG